MEIISHINTKREQQAKIPADLEPGRMGDIDSARTGDNPVKLFFYIIEKCKRIEPHTGSQG